MARGCRRAAVVFAALAIPCAVAVAAEFDLMAEESAGIYPVDAENRFRIDSIRGTLLVRAGKPGEVRFLASRVGDRKTAAPIRLWSDGATVRLTPVPGREDAAVRLEASVPPEFLVTVETDGSEIHAAGLQGELEIEGADLELDVRGIQASVAATVEAGRARIQGIAGDVTLRGSGLEVAVELIDGDAFLVLAGGRAKVDKIRGDLEVDADDVELAVAEVSGSFRLRGRAGAADVRGLRVGGEIELSGTTLEISGCEGDLDIRTDAEVRFRDNKASMHVDSYGASVRGFGNSGLLEVKTDGAAVVLEEISGPVRVQGDSLEVRLAKIGGELMVFANSSSIEIEGATAPVRVESEFGDVRVRNASAEVDVLSRDGEVSLTNQSGPVQVDADGPDVHVSFASIDAAKDSLIRNEGGDVSVHFPGRGGCRVEATSGFGRIETDLSDVVVSDDGTRATGLLNRRRRPLVRVESGGAVVLGSLRAVEEEP